VGTFGVQDLDSRRPVNADTLFRIASMTKAFTALTVLKLRDEGRVHLDANAEDYVPEMRDWKYPTEDSRRIRVRDLLSHSGGFVTDDPWGDRQTPLPEADFSRLLREGVPFTRAPGISYEYSNLGYALLGRIVTNVSQRPYAETITQTLLMPLGMTSSGFVAEAAPTERRALGYRWEDDAWRPEPLLGPGAFGAMGGLIRAHRISDLQGGHSLRPRHDRCDGLRFGRDSQPRRRLPGIRLARPAAARSRRGDFCLRKPHLCRPQCSGVGISGLSTQSGRTARRTRRDTLPRAC
jgi:CubicO group peptidase (beta-lactamase class C family)